MGDARWDPVASQFVHHYTRLYGQVRTHVLHAHLMQHLPPPPAAIVDIGGGAGHQSIELAREGYAVTIVDPSSVMLTEAARMLEDEPREVAARVQLVESDAERQVNGLGIDTRADDIDELSELLHQHGVDRIAWYGVRLFTESWARDRPAVDPVDDVLAAELEASRRDPYRQLSRLFHLVGRRSPS